MGAKPEEMQTTIIIILITYIFYQKWWIYKLDNRVNKELDDIYLKDYRSTLEKRDYNNDGATTTD